MSCSDEETLAALIQVSRTPEGREGLSGVLADTLFLLPASPSRLLLLRLRLLRNLLAGHEFNQYAFIERSGPSVVAASVLSSPSLAPDAVRAALQALGNTALAGELHRDAVWEALCLRHVVGPAPPAGPATRAVVAALGGYRRLYRLCLGPALDRLGRAGGGALAQAQAAESRAHHLSLSLSLSLFSIDCYERLGVGAGGAGAAAGRQQPPPPSSLLFLCKPVDVS